MRIANIRSMDISNGTGIGASLFVQGCHFHCKNCFNPETWDFNGGKEYTEETQERILKLIEPEYITRFSILGGEPLEPQNSFHLAELINLIKRKRPDIKIWVYTGYTIENLYSRCYCTIGEDSEAIPSQCRYLRYILNSTDVLVDGQFQEDKKDLTYPFAGSTNQRVISMQESRKQNKIVLLDI